MAEKQTEKSSILARNAGAFLMAAALCALGAVMAYGSTLKITSPLVMGFAVVGLVCLGAWFVGRSQQAAMPRDQWSKQRSMMGANSMFSTLLFLLLLVSVNYIAARRHKTFDWTSNKVNILAEQSEKALQKLAGPVTLSYVYAPAQGQLGPGPAEVVLLDKYKNASDKIRVNIINAAEEPGKLEALSLTGFNGRPVVLVQSEDKKTGGRQQVDIVDEQNLTSALMKLGEQKTRVFYHLVGHGEASLDGGNASFSQAKAKLTSQGYTFKPLSLATGKAAIPGDAAIVAALNPTADLSAGEAKILTDYMAAKGHLLVLLTPSSRPMPRWRALAKSLGVTLLDGFVADPQQYVSSPQVPVAQVSDVTKHAVLGGVGQNTAVVFPGAIPMKVASPQGLTVTSVLESSPASKAVPFSRTGAMQDGPFTLLAAAERSAAPGAPSGPDMRAVFVGSGGLGADTNFGAYANGDMFLSAVNWVAGNELLVSIPPKEPVRNTLDMPPSVRRFSVIFSVFTLPLLVLLLGGLMWWKRR